MRSHAGSHSGHEHWYDRFMNRRSVIELGIFVAAAGVATSQMTKLVDVFDHPVASLDNVAASSDSQKKIAFFDAHCIKEKESIYKTGTLLIYSCPKAK